MDHKSTTNPVIRSRVTLIAILVVLILGCGGMAWGIVKKLSDKDVETNETEAEIEDTIYEDTEISDIEKIIELRIEKINNMATDEEKAEAYLELADELDHYQAVNLAFWDTSDSGDGTVEIKYYLDESGDQVEKGIYSDQVLEFAYKAEELNPDASSAFAIYCYENEYNGEEAGEKYYQILLEREPNIETENTEGKG